MEFNEDLEIDEVRVWPGAATWEVGHVPISH